jgi:hypothetical protein
MGVEIKVSKSDWRKELANGEKADDIAKYCRFWYVAAPRDVVPVAEVPPNWGLIECPKPGTCEVVKAPVELTPQQPDMLLVASILRKASSVMVPADDVARRVQEAREMSHVRCVPKNQYDNLRESVDAFEEASGLRLPEYSHQSKQLGREVEVARAMRLPDLLPAARNLLDLLEKTGKEVREGMEKLECLSVVPKETKRQNRRRRRCPHDDLAEDRPRRVDAQARQPD